MNGSDIIKNFCGFLCPHSRSTLVKSSLGSRRPLLLQGLLLPAPTRNKFVRTWSSGSLSTSASTTGSGNDSSNASSTNLKSGFKFEGANDIVRIVMLEIQSASDLPPLTNSTFNNSLFFFY